MLFNKVLENRNKAYGDMNKNNRVLLVDDDTDDLMILQDAILELFPNMECISRNNGKAALEFVEKNPPPPKYIFLDINMPFMNGFEFLKEFPREDGSNKTTIFIYSTSSSQKDKERAKSLGADEYIVKYTDLPSLKARLKTVLRFS